MLKFYFGPSATAASHQGVDTQKNHKSGESDRHPLPLKLLGTRRETLPFGLNFTFLLRNQTAETITFKHLLGPKRTHLL